MTRITTRGYTELGVGRTSLGYLVGSIGSYLIRITTFGYAELGVGSTDLGRLAGRAGGAGSSRGIGVSDSSGGIGVSDSSGGMGVSDSAGAARSTSILANFYSYSVTSSEVFPRFLILYYLLYTGLYPFYFIRYLVIILRPLEKVRLFSRYSILYDLRVRVSPSIKILLG